MASSFLEESSLRLGTIRPAWVLAAAIVLGAALDLTLLGAKSIGLDESTSVLISRMDWPTFGKLLWWQQGNMSLYYVLLRSWIHLGESEGTIRMLSVLPAVAAVPALYALGSRLFGRSVGAVAALLLSINAFHTRFAQEARGYSLLVLLVILSSYFFVRFIERPSPRFGLGYTAAAILSVYAHFFGLLVLAAQWFSLVLRGRPALPRSLVGYVGLIGIGLLPVAAFLLQSDPGGIEWIPRPTPGRVFYVVYALAGGVGEGARAVFLGGGAVLLAAYSLACLRGLVASVQTWTSSGRSDRSWRTGFVVSWLLVPMVLALAVSLVQPVFERRYLIVCLPALALLASIGLLSFRRTTAVLIAALLLATSAVQAVRFYAAPGGGWRMATSLVLSRAGPDDTLIFYPPFLQQPFDYYRSRMGLAGGESALLWDWDWEKIAEGHGVGFPLTDGIVRELSKTSQSVWIVTRSIDPVERAVLQALSRRYALATVWNFSDVRVLEHRRITGAGPRN